MTNTERIAALEAQVLKLAKCNRELRDLQGERIAALESRVTQAEKKAKFHGLWIDVLSDEMAELKLFVSGLCADIPEGPPVHFPRPKPTKKRRNGRKVA